ncbi:glycosyltransferase [Rufibacter glacialis]|uniref:Glycosyltransferase n=1 Tax=Rufibacter glacialis TaxID=1259555 RepID=A0A5M8Q735_9BACT|nr:glycosyltransferase [Rufibacter glacialis]KAA6431745.1 glycosyltransferase [Rufibacter glacialis]GGK81966.1 glycosyl transferase [Rufibacter glacialis]
MLFSSVFLVVYFLLFLALLGLWGSRKPKAVPLLQEFPRVSILIAARNEEENIHTCLTAISRLHYPKDKLEVLVGDDRSSDQTRHLVEQFSQDHPYVRCLPILETLPNTKGKANVLAQLAHHATTEYFFITDADIEVPTTWVETMLQHLKPWTGIVTGITTTKGGSLFERLQTLDWLYNLGLMQVVADQGVPVSTMGNNMLVTRQAYEGVGGFEGIPFSITEDVQLFRQVLEKGFKTGNVYDPAVLAWSAPAPNLGTLLHQRRRWMRGSVHLPWYMLLLFVVHSSYYPVWLPYFLHTSMGVFAAIFAFKVLLQSLFVLVCAHRVGVKVKGLDLFFLEFYLLFTSMVLIIFFFLPLKIRWKGRLY